MTTPIEDLLARIHALQEELEAEFQKKREEFAYVIEGKRWTEVTSRQWISNGKDRPLQVSFEAFLDNADKALIAAVVESCTHMVVGAPVPK